MANRYMIWVRGYQMGTQNNCDTITQGNESNAWLRFTNDAGSLNNNDPFNGLRMVNHVGQMIDGGKAHSAKQVRCAFDRAGNTTGNLAINFMINMYYSPAHGDPNLILHKLRSTMVNSSETELREGLVIDTTTSQGLANYWLWMIKHGRFFDEVSGNQMMLDDKLIPYAADGTTALTYDDAGEGGGTSSFSYGSGYAFVLKGASPYDEANFTANMQVQGGLEIKKFQNSPAFEMAGVDIVTKDIDFDFPGVRKKIYKVVVSYRGPLPLGNTGNIGSDRVTNIKPYFSINGSNQLRDSVDGEFENTDWMDFDIQNLPSTLELEDGGNTPDLRWMRQELVPDENLDAGIWNNIYSMSLRFRSIGPVRAFEINDISVIYRLKGLK